MATSVEDCRVELAEPLGVGEEVDLDDPDDVSAGLWLAMVLIRPRR